MDNDCVLEKELVIHDNYGGFHLNKEMAIWLVENRNWITTNNHDKDLPLNYIFYDNYDYFYRTGYDTIFFISQKDLCDCVKDIQNKYIQKKYSDSNSSFTDKYNYIFSLKVIKIKINVFIESYNDGHEKICCDYQEI
jgi:hypothetical protein